MNALGYICCLVFEMALKAIIRLLDESLKSSSWHKEYLYIYNLLIADKCATIKHVPLAIRAEKLQLYNPHINCSTGGKRHKFKLVKLEVSLVRAGCKRHFSALGLRFRNTEHS